MWVGSSSSPNKSSSLPVLRLLKFCGTLCFSFKKYHFSADPSKEMEMATDKKSTKILNDFLQAFVFSRGHTTLHLAESVGTSHF